MSSLNGIRKQIRSLDFFQTTSSKSKDRQTVKPMQPSYLVAGHLSCSLDARSMYPIPALKSAFQSDLPLSSVLMLRLPLLPPDRLSRMILHLLDPVLLLLLLLLAVFLLLAALLMPPLRITLYPRALLYARSSACTVWHEHHIMPR